MRLTPRSLKILTWALTLSAGGLFIGGAISNYRRLENSYQNDFLVYYRTAARVGRGQLASVYSTSDGAYPFRYSPTTLLFLEPMKMLTEAQAREFWLFAQVIAFALGLYFLYRA